MDLAVFLSVIFVLFFVLVSMCSAFCVCYLREFGAARRCVQTLASCPGTCFAGLSLRRLIYTSRGLDKEGSRAGRSSTSDRRHAAPRQHPQPAPSTEKPKNGFQGGQPLNLETLLMLRRRRRGSVSEQRSIDAQGHRHQHTHHAQAYGAVPAGQYSLHCPRAARRRAGARCWWQQGH